MERKRNENGQFLKENVKKRREDTKKEHGFTEIKNEADMIAVNREIIERLGLADKNERIDNMGFTQDFYDYLGFSAGRNYRYAAPEPQNIRKSHTGDMLTLDVANFHTPLDDFYGTPEGGDMVNDYGRIPVSHLMKLSDQRLGIVFHGTHEIATEVFRNRFMFVDYYNPEKVRNGKNIKEVFNWMKHSFYWTKMVESLDFERRCGLGHSIATWKRQPKVSQWKTKAPKTRPDGWEAASSYYMTPMNIYETSTLDYNKREWNFYGGIRGGHIIDSSRVYPLETRRVEWGIRGRAIAELCWTPLMCYLNTMYYVLKSLSQLGTVTIGIQTEQEYVTPKLVSSYLAVQKAMRANKCYVLGKGGKLQVENAAGKIGSGIETYLEFLREDISSAWVIPKNQLFGRADGGGLEGAGAVISKEDKLAMLSGLQMDLTDDIMWMLENMCNFKGLDDLTLRWNLDMHKTEEQRLKESAMREQLEQEEIMTKQTKLGFKLYKQQVKLQMAMGEVQMQMIKDDPEKLMGISDKDEENLGEKGKEKTKDFIRSSKYFETLQKQFAANQQLLQQLNGDMVQMKQLKKDNWYLNKKQWNK